MPRIVAVPLALLMLVASLPVMLAVAIALWIDGMRPIFYRGTRIGQHGRPFTMLKFRTIRVIDPGSPGTSVREGAAGGHQAGTISPLCRFLRRSRLDELPQIVHVLTGQLDLVGYRPPLPDYVARHPEVYGPLLAARPGLTGLASVLFHKREDRILAHARSAEEATRLHARLCIPAKARLDRFYLAHRSTAFDLRIIAMTLARLWTRPQAALTLPPVRLASSEGLG